MTKELLGGVVLFFLTFLSYPARAQVTIEGHVPLPKAAQEAVPAGRYQVQTKKRIAPPLPPVAAVYLEGEFQGAAPFPEPMPAEMKQLNYRFQPRLLVIQTGMSVSFPNMDFEYHSLFSYSKPKRFDLGRYRRNEAPPTVTFDKPGIVNTYCEIHEHMRGTILVVDTPYFTTTDEAGRYRLENLPPGDYVLKAWVNKKEYWEKPVTLKDGQTLKVNFE